MNGNEANKGAGGDLSKSRTFRAFTPQLSLIDYRNYSSHYLDKLKIKKANSKVIRYDQDIKEISDIADETKMVCVVIKI